ncbi:MAG TPA: DUF3122 domain-containing protein [Xenococcaceae cyanobacterium]
MKKIAIFLNLAVVLIFSFSQAIAPALAVLREHHQTSEVLSYHVQHSIQDRQNRAWQVILFPEDIKQKNSQYYLRLVGFPGLVELVHPHYLEIITDRGNVLMAADVFAESTPAANVGQYNVTEVLPQLPEKGSVNLVISIAKANFSSQDIMLKIPSSILTEWQWLYQSINS